MGLDLSLVNLAVDGDQWIHRKDLSPSETDICANLFESAGICIKLTHEVTETLCGGRKLLLEKIGAGIRVGGCLFVLDPR